MSLKLRNLKMASFRRGTLADLQTAVNDFTAGKALTALQSGTVIYAAVERGERTLVDQQYTFSIDGGAETHAVVLFYVE